MFEVGMEIIRVYPQLGDETYIAEGEITSVSEDADGETLVAVMYDDGAVKVYTEGAVKKMLVNGRMFATHGEAGRVALKEALEEWV